jgi:hypothetical protein
MTTLPFVHLNGTSKKELLEGYIDVANALSHAIDVVQKNAPNMRDYYLTQNGSAAMSEHQERLRKLQSVLDDIREIGEHVAVLG